MKTKEISEEEYKRLQKGYDTLLNWIESNDIGGEETLGLLMKASVSLAVFNDVPRDQFLHVVRVLYEIESIDKPHPTEVH